MNTSQMRKTIGFTAAALVLAAAAFLITRPRVTIAEAFNDQGQAFFPDFKDPAAATTLEVIDYDADTASAIPFKVALEPGKGWGIPSHHDYPADAKDRLARTAAGVIDLKKDVIVSDSAEQWPELEVVDPLDTKTPALQGRGKRVTLKDNAGSVLADLIIGKAVPGRENQRYVRMPDQKRSYAVNLPAEFSLSTRFGDWIETNLLKLNAADLVKFTIDNHKVDPEMGTVQTGDVVSLVRPDPAKPWTLTELPPERELDTAKLSGLTSALADLKIVGVRPKPPGLTAELKSEASGEAGIKLAQDSIRSLASRGFYLTRDGRLLSNQGDVIAATSQGIVYTLRFGEVTFATGEALTAGGEEEGSPEPTSADAKPDTPGDATKPDAASDPTKKSPAAESRFLFLTAQFDPNLIPKPEPPPADGELPARAFARTPQEIQAEADAIKRRQEDYDRKLADGKKLAQELAERFAAWYYVVPGEAFRSIVLDRAGLSREKTAAAAGAMPGGPTGIPGLPPGMQIPGFPPPRP